MSWPIIGHGWAVDILRHHIQSGQLSHAYLFTGPEGVGKTTLGLTLAQALLCESEEKPCGQCRACRHVAAGIHPDVRLVEPEGHLLRVEQVREVTREASRRPVEAPYRVFILSHMERAHPAAANALLKTLEEPPAHVILILTAPAEDAILPTLVSRCQVLHLRPVPQEELRDALVDRLDIPSERAELLARVSGGRPGLALRLAQDATYWEERDQVFQIVDELLENPSRWRRLQLAETWARLEEEQLVLRVKLLESGFRDILMAQTGREDMIHHVDKRETILAWSRRLPEAKVRHILNRALETERYLRRPINKRLLLDVLFLEIGGGDD
ncbi:MAG: DNA polymerase III subunit delta' [Chloroflexi bacterium]|nr:DNA polymerase III subunit delta' [Chloroflexota bacterium]